MINADKGNLQIKGGLTPITFELNAILDYFVRHEPEVLGGTLAVWGDKLKEALSTDSTNVELLDLARVMSEKYIKLKEELSDE